MDGRASWLVFAVLAAWVLGAPGTALGQCRVRLDAPVTFGTYSPFSETPLETNGRIQWRCQGGTSTRVMIQLSRGASPDWTWRRLSNGSDYLRYHLYLDSACTRVWGDGSPGTYTYSQSYPGSGWVTVSVFAKIPINQDAAPGNYTDSVIAVINF